MSAICVKYLIEKEAAASPEELEDEDESTNLKGYVTTFRISNKTTFNDLLKEACSFWGITKYSEYELTDEKMNPVSEKEKLDKDPTKYTTKRQASIEVYYKNKGQEVTQYMVYLRKTPSDQSIADSKQDATKIEIQNGDGEYKKKEHDVSQEFFEQYPGLKAYLEIDKTKIGERNKEIETKKDPINRLSDNHCAVFTVILLILIFTIVPLTGERSIIALYYTLSSFEKAFGVNSDTYDVSSQDYTWQGIARETNFYEFLNYTLGKNLFYADPSLAATEGGAILSSNSVIGGVRLRQMRVLTRNCSNIPSEFQAKIPCYYQDYDKSIRDTQQINLTGFTSTSGLSFQNEWTSWRDADTLGHEVGVSGALASYDGSGYTVDIPWGTAQSDVQKFVADLKSSGYIAPSTRAVVISFTLYNQVGEFFIYTEMIVEVISTGILYPSKVTMIPFRTSFRSAATGRPPHQTYDALRIICAILLNLFILYRVICSEGKLDLKYLIKLQGILNVLIVIFCYVSVAFTNGLGRNSVAQNSLTTFLTSLVYIDMKHLALGYESAIVIMGVICGLTIARLASLLTMSSKFYMIITSLEGAWKQIIYYCIVLIPILFAFTEAAVSLLGLHSQFFNNFGDAFITVLMFGFGQVNGSVFVGSKASTLIVIFFALFYFFVTFFLVTVFAGIYIDSYRVTIMDYGYHFIDKNKWTYKELLMWLVPKFVYNKTKKMLKSLKKKILRIKDEDDEGKQDGRWYNKEKEKKAKDNE